MNWIARLNAAMDYIEEHLDGEISYREIAGIVHNSAYNFQRIFSCLAGVPLAEYIRSRRLTLAAYDIQRSDTRLIDVAVKYGYESQDAFTRAFKAFHGVVPSAVRSDTVMLKSSPKLSFQMSVKGENPMNYRIESWPSFTAAGFRHPIKTGQAFDAVPGIWEKAWLDGSMNRLTGLFTRADMRPAGYLGIAIGGQWGASEDMDYFIGVTNHVDAPNCARVPVPDGMEEAEFKAATWVMITADGELPDAVQNVIRQFYSQWLPGSGYQPDDLPLIECYMQDSRQEVWIAVRKD